MTIFKGRHALVTGGGGGIGAAAAGALTRSGATVTILGRNAETLQAQVAAGHAAGYVIADLTDPAATAAAVAGLPQPVDLLVNNAGASASAPFLRSSDDDFARMLEVNLMTAVRLTRLVLPGMTERGFGRVVNVASVAALRGYPYVAAYVASKHALLGFTRALALETAKSGVTVNAVCPGYVDTEMTVRSVEKIAAKTGRSAEQAKSTLAAYNPQGRLIQPVEVAAAIVFLCGDDAGGVNGAALPISGGEF